MANKKELLLALMKANYRSPNWYPGFEEALANLQMSQADLNSGEDSHSIWEIVNHLSYWNERWLNRFKNANLEKSIENDLTFKEGDKEKLEERWTLTVKKIHEIFLDWESEIEKTTEILLDSPIDGNPNNGLWWEAISNLILHTTYHIGQIITLRKQQNNWVNKY